MLSGLALVAAASAGTAHAQDGYPPLELLLKSQTTVIGQQFSYPDGAAEVTVAIVTMQPGEATAWHLHDAPLIAHVLEGEITLDYDTDGTRTFSAGDTFVEAFQSRHRGINSGNDILRILAVFAGAAGTPNTVLE